jgi:signal transduction histidine kinase
VAHTSLDFPAKNKEAVMHSSPPANSPVTLETVIATAQLSQRPVRPTKAQEENKAFHDLANFLASEPDTFLDRLVEVAKTLCSADTAGISIEETDAKGERIFRWVAMAGELKHLVGGTTPRNFSPCGVCVDTNQPLLMEGLDRFYPYFKEAPLPIIEALLLPWGVKDGPVGTLWIVAHNEQRKFDSHDVRLMNSLAAFAAGGIYLRETMREVERVAATSKITSEMAHHINNPLQGALLALFLLKSDEKLGPSSRGLLLLLETQVNRVAEMSNGLLARSTINKK